MIMSRFSELKKLASQDVFAACVLVVNDDGKILAVSRKNDPSDFGLPGGKIDPGEKPIEAAARELEEETGLKVSNLTPIFTHQAAGKLCTTFTGSVEGDINTNETGIIQWVEPEILTRGSFGDYNQALFQAIGIPIEKSSSSRLYELQYIADTLLLEKIARDLAPINKKSGIISDALIGIAAAIKNQVVNALDTSSPGAFIQSVLRFLEPAIFFRIHWLLGTIATAAQVVFGFSVTDILADIVRSITPKLERGEKVSPEEVNQAAAGAVGVTASLDSLRKLEKRGFFGRKRYFGGAHQAGGAFLFPGKGTSMWERAFGFLGRGRTGSLLIGIVAWFAKTILASAGLLGVGSAAMGLFDYKPKSKDKTTTTLPPAQPTQRLTQRLTPFTPSTQPKFAPPMAPVIGLQASGWGEKYYRNGEKDVWYEPIVPGNIKETLWGWAVRVYPELSEHENLVLSDPSFNRTANLLSNWLDPVRTKYIKIPNGIHTLKQIVDTFAGNVARKIKRTKNAPTGI